MSHFLFFYKILTIWNVIPYRLVEGHKRFEGVYCFHFHGISNPSFPKKKTVSSSETSLPTYQSTRCQGQYNTNKFAFKKNRTLMWFMKFIATSLNMDVHKHNIERYTSFIGMSLRHVSAVHSTVIRYRIQAHKEMCATAETYPSLFFLLWRCDPTWVMASSFLRFLDHTQPRTTVDRTPLDEWSARLRELYLTTHNTHNRQTSMPPVGFEPTISAGERPQTARLRPHGHCLLNP